MDHDRPRCPQCNDVLIEGECVQHGVIDPAAVVAAEEPPQPTAEQMAAAPPGQRARVVTPDGGGPSYVVFEPESVARQRERDIEAARAASEPVPPPPEAAPATSTPSIAGPAPTKAPASPDDPVVIDQKALLIAGALSVVLLIAALFGLWRGQSRVDDRLDALDASIAALQDRLVGVDEFESTATNRLRTLESKIGETFNAKKLSRQVLKSVVTIRVGSGADAVLGSGFVARSGSGGSTIITNFHVVQGASNDRVTVRQEGLGGVRGRITKIDPGNDLAAIKINKRLPALDLSQRFPQRGTQVLAVGSPLGLSATISEGTVSGKFRGLIQFTAPVSPGSSGGPLVNGNGKVVGVVTIKVVGFGAEGIAFAVPAGQLCSQVLDC